ncbi:hypothetical protein VN97_g10458 [Penicillium thymicola]|uniref:HIT domain-containing protein n=1 Tax=Penicillium thymicola TaxID=293382 RepID=A0AAI9T928_PENTH|nr:hypothetical protein VN97_g10458 [Penicillium thymicola]
MSDTLLDEYVFIQNRELTAALTSEPTTPGHVIVNLASPLFINTAETKHVLEVIRQIARNLRDVTSSKRCGMAYDGDKLLHVIPLHGLQASWSAILDSEKEFHKEFPGYLSTKSGPELNKEELDDMQKCITAKSGLSHDDFDTNFHGDLTDNNLFTRIIRGGLPQWRVWENSSHVAFLTPFANTPGFTVLVPRKHTSSDIFSLDTDEYNALVEATCSVAMLLKRSLNLEMCGMFFEGLEIDYTHAKLVPVHIHTTDCELLKSPLKEDFHELYRGSISTRLGSTSYPAKELYEMTRELRSRFQV